MAVRTIPREGPIPEATRSTFPHVNAHPEVNQIEVLFKLAYSRLNREEGQGLTEYAFLLVGIVAVVGAIVALITTGLTDKIGEIF